MAPEEPEEPERRTEIGYGYVYPYHARRHTEEEMQELRRVVYVGELYPHELVIALHRRARALQRLRLVRLTVGRIVKKPLPANRIVSFLAPRRLPLTADYLTRQEVPADQVFLTLRRWFWTYGKVAVPRNLRALVAVEPGYALAVKAECEEDCRE